MITQFKIFENSETETSFILNDLITYYNGNNSKIERFLFNLLCPGTIVKFNCDFRETVESINDTLIRNQTRKGVINKLIQWAYEGDDYILLSLRLENDKQIYFINDEYSFIIYGNIPTRYKNIIDKLNIIHQTKKFNI